MSLYYQDDHVRLFHGDCREVTEWLSADVLVVDPPYGIDIHFNHRRQIANDGDAGLRDWILAEWGASRPALVFGRWDTSRPVATRRRLVWDKGDTPGKGDLTFPWGTSDEEIYVLGSDWPRVVPAGRRREGNQPARFPSVVRVPPYNSQSADRPDHPTPKPVVLLEYLLRPCPPGVVADPCAGSGPTLVAAKLLGRHAIGVEIEERYCEIAARRLAQDTLPFGEAS